MAAILDTSPYPWHERDAVTLHQTLYKAVPRAQRVTYFAAAAGIDVGLVNSEQAPFDLWYDVLNLAATSGKARSLVETLRADPNLAPSQPIFDALLQDHPSVADQEPSGSAFLKHDDLVTVPEALLFHDDLTLSTGRVGWLIGVLERIQKLSPSVCRLE